MKKLILKTLLVLGLFAMPAAASVSLPYTFLPNTSISSSQMNSNLGALRDEINTHEAATNPHQTGLSDILGVSNSCGSTSINFNLQQAVKMKVENVAADPSAGNAGRIFYNIISGLLKIDTGSTMVVVGGLSSGSCSSLSDAAASCSTDATNATNISSGTLSASRLPNPAATTLGGVKSLALISHQFLTSIGTNGTPTQAQPSFSDLLSNISTSQMNSGTGATAGAFWIGSGTWHVPSFSDLLNNISVLQMNSGTSATSGSFWRGDGTWTEPTFAQILGNISTSQMNSGTSASSATFWRGDGTWANPIGSLTAPTLQNFTSTGTTTGYVFVITSGNATVGSTWTNNAHTFTALETISSGTLLFTSGASAPSGSGTLTKASGTGDGTLTFSSATALATYTAPANVLYTKFRGCAAGGAGGGASNAGSGAGAGGGAGSSFEHFVSSPTTCYYSIGVTGTVGDNTGSSGTAGTPTYLSCGHITTNGGGGGPGETGGVGAGGAGGAAGTGANGFNSAGGDGSNGSASALGGDTAGGTGGGSIFGNGGFGGKFGTVNASAGKAPCSGGGGGGVHSTGQAGALGAAGILQAEEHYQ